MSELKKEFKYFMNDLEKNIKNKEDLEYVKGRTTEFMNVVLDQMEHILTYKEDKLSQIEKIQKDLSTKINNIQREIEDIEQDIYLDDSDEYEVDDEEDYDFEIVCPYCDNEFLIDLNQENSEIECPNCNNVIELDWTGNLEDSQEETNFGCNKGHCSGCHGCGSMNDEEDDM